MVKKILWIVSLVFALLVPLVIPFLAKKLCLYVPDLKDQLLEYMATTYSAIGTIFLGFIALWQSHKANHINNLLICHQTRPMLLLTDILPFDAKELEQFDEKNFPAKLHEIRYTNILNSKKVSDVNYEKISFLFANTSVQQFFYSLKIMKVYPKGVLKKGMQCIKEYEDTDWTYQRLIKTDESLLVNVSAPINVLNICSEGKVVFEFVLQSPQGLVFQETIKQKFRKIEFIKDNKPCFDFVFSPQYQIRQIGFR